MEVLNTVFTVCIIVGFTMPILNLLFGVFDGMDADTGLEVGHHVMLGLNFMSLMLSITVFGLVGKMLSFRFHILLVILIAVLCGIADYIVIFRFVFLPLKKNQNIIRIHEMKDLVGRPGVLILQITQDSYGTVKTEDSTGAVITYKAAAEKEELEKYNNCIKSGTEVAIVGVDEEKQCCLIRVIDF